MQYTTEARLIRVMCSGRIDLGFVLRAFSNGMDGVFIGGCRLNECNYITHGNYDALGMVYLCRTIMEHIGLNPNRLNIEFMSSGEGNIFIEVVNDFVGKIKDLGPLGTSDGIGKKDQKTKLEAVARLVPYIKLVERERLRAPVKSEEAYRQFFTSDETNRLINELIIDKIKMSHIMLSLKEKPLSTREISETSGLDPSEVSRHLNNSSRQGFVKYDTSKKRYALA